MEHIPCKTTLSPQKDHPTRMEWRMKSFLSAITLSIGCLAALVSGCDNDKDDKRSSIGEITSFQFLTKNNKTLNRDINATINGINITFEAPSGTDFTQLVPTVGIKGKSISPASGVAQNFSKPVTYTVTAEDGSKKGYTVYALEDVSPYVGQYQVQSAILQSAVSVPKQGDRPALKLDAQSKQEGIFSTLLFSSYLACRDNPALKLKADKSLAFVCIASDGSAAKEVATGTYEVRKNGTDKQVILTLTNDNIKRGGQGDIVLNLPQATVNNETLSGVANGLSMPFWMANGEKVPQDFQAQSVLLDPTLPNNEVIHGFGFSLILNKLPTTAK